MIVVPVLIISCQLSLNLKIGPAIAHSMMIATAVPNAAGCPIARAVALAHRLNRDVDRIDMGSSKCIHERGIAELVSAPAHRSPKEVSSRLCRFHFLTSVFLLVVTSFFQTESAAAQSIQLDESLGQLEYGTFL